MRLPRCQRTSLCSDDIGLRQQGRSQHRSSCQNKHLPHFSVHPTTSPRRPKNSPAFVLHTAASLASTQPACGPLRLTSRLAPAKDPRRLRSSSGPDIQARTFFHSGPPSHRRECRRGLCRYFRESVSCFVVNHLRSLTPRADDSFLLARSDVPSRSVFPPAHTQCHSSPV